MVKEIKHGDMVTNGRVSGVVDMNSVYPDVVVAGEVFCSVMALTPAETLDHCRFTRVTVKRKHPKL